MRRTIPVLLLLAACGPADSTEPWTTPLDTSGLEPAVAARIEERRAACESDPTATALTRLGKALLAHDLHEEAETAFLSAAAAAQDKTTRFAALYLAGVCAGRVSHDRARTHFERALAEDRSYLPVSLRLGRLHEEAGAFDRARVYFESARELDPESSHALLGLGRVDLAQGRVTSAIRHLERALSLRPDHHEVRAALARAYSLAGREDDARRAAASALVRRQRTPFRDPIASTVLDEVVSYDGLLQAAAQAGELRDEEQAFVFIARAMEVSRERVEAPLLAARLFELSNRPRDALVALEQVLDRRPGHVEALSRSGTAMAMLGRRKEAEERLRGALNAAPRSLLAGERLARLLVRDRPAESRELAEQLLVDHPDAVGPRLLLAKLLGGRGDYEGARGHLARIVRTHPDHDEAKRLLRTLPR